MRVLIAGTGSGCGKTTASLVVMAALREAGLSVAPYKAGPDYIDPGFHRAVCGVPSHNLDAFLMREDAMRYLLQSGADIAVIESVMGFYDGLDARTLEGSTWALAGATRTPVILVADASGGAASVAAQVHGFATLVRDSHIAGVLVNRVSGERHYALVREAVAHYTGLPCVGYLKKDVRLDLKSRHLGLVPAQEVPDVAARVAEAARDAADTLDIPALLAIAQTAPALCVEGWDDPRSPQCLMRPERPPYAGFRLGVAMDEAFSFYYQANLDLLRAQGMELVPFSPLRDGALPEGLDALYIGGGFPEVFARQLEENRPMRAGIRLSLERGMRCYAECGGLMYLSQEIDGREMVGFLPARCRMTERLQRFGYVRVEDRTGLVFPAHEFHHAVAQPVGEAAYAYRVTKASDPARTWRCGFERGGTLAAFAHLHFLSHPELIGRLFA